MDGSPRRWHPWFLLPPPHLSMKTQKFDFWEPSDRLLPATLPLARHLNFVPCSACSLAGLVVGYSHRGCRTRHANCDVMGAIAIIPPPSSAPPSSVILLLCVPNLTRKSLER
jgi:hypothetical protein